MSELPHAKASLTFISREEGGREIPLTQKALTGYRYRPHIVIGDPTIRETRSAIPERIQRINERDGEYLGIAFYRASREPVVGEELEVQFAFMYYPNVTYQDAVVGAEFTLREGARIIGFGSIIEVFTQKTLSG